MLVYQASLKPTTYEFGVLGKNAVDYFGNLKDLNKS